MLFGNRQRATDLTAPTLAAGASGRLPLMMLVTATMLFALGPAVLKLLTERGAELGLVATSVSFCNVLFVGNLCAGVVTLMVGKPARIVGEIRMQSRQTTWLLVLGAVVSTIYPALLFTGLAYTTVTNAVLVSRFNGIVYVLLAFLFFEDRLRLPEALGYGAIALGVTILVLRNNDGAAIATGDLFVLLATLFFALNEILSRKVLPRVSIQSYVFFRNFVSAIIFFLVAIVFFGPSHFMDVFMGDLWILMIVYAVFAIVAAQSLWLGAIRSVPARIAANTQMMNPVFSIFFAFILLGEIPAAMQWIAIVIIASGMLLPRLWPGASPRPAMPPVGVGTGIIAK